MIETQTNIFDQPVGLHNGTETSVEAAIEVGRKISRYQRVIIRTVAESLNGMTRDELAMITGLPTATICARCRELVLMNLLNPRYEHGEKIKRKTRSGKNAEVLFLR
tara:strand:- start:31 stop:351 length:321 start_codon:yes stop_codon:yes gene_type:complete